MPKPPPPPGTPTRRASAPPDQIRSPRPPKLDETGDFPPEARIRRRWEFNRIHRQGIRVHTPRFTVIALRSLTGVRPRFGCAVSRKVGRAVVRNRLRRMMKEMFRRSAAELPLADVVVIVRPDAAVYARRGLLDLATELQPAMLTAARRAMDQKPRKAPRRRPRR